MRVGNLRLESFIFGEVMLFEKLIIIAPSKTIMRYVLDTLMYVDV